MKHTLHTLPLSNSFAQLPGTFYSRVRPTPFEQPAELIHFNTAAAELLDLDPAVADDPACVDVFSGRQLLPGADPLAMLYAGHQFGHYVPQLGDGRAIILGETTNRQQARWEIQLKGCGQTPYSRDGDGRAVLRSTIREYLCSEAMHGLGIPTTRALCITGSREEVYREQIETGAMLTRLAPSHVRFGSFEVFFYRNRHDALQTLADYVIATHYPELQDTEQPYVALLQAVVDKTANLLAQWQAVGFAHGVMNTDNMSVLGLTLDYGPFGFMEAYDPGLVCNHSDHHGRYAFDQQPQVALFNLSCLAQTLLPLVDVEAARAALEAYQLRVGRHSPAAAWQRTAGADGRQRHRLHQPVPLPVQHRLRNRDRNPCPARPVYRSRAFRPLARGLSGRAAQPRQAGYRAPAGDAGRQPEIRAAQLHGADRHRQGDTGARLHRNRPAV
jgi:uncharacterized protein YdiU (UPF0061 family)